MARTEITGDQIRDESITGEDIKDGSICRQDINITSTGKAVVRKIIAGSDIDIDYTGVDAGTGDVTVNISSSTGLITAVQHRNLDQLVHSIAETCYYEITRAGNKVTRETWWTDSNKTIKIREIEYTYSGSLVSQIVTKQYDTEGALLVGETITETISRTGLIVDTISYVAT